MSFARQYTCLVVPRAEGTVIFRKICVLRKMLFLNFVVLSVRKVRITAVIIECLMGLWQR